jgi:hypothetical protein
VVDIREGGVRKRPLRGMRYNNVKALGQRVRNKTVLTLFDRAEYLSSNRFLKSFRRMCVDGLLDYESDVLRAAWRSAPARGLKRGNFGVVGVINTKKVYTNWRRRGLGRVIQSRMSDGKYFLSICFRDKDSCGGA